MLQFFEKDLFFRGMAEIGKKKEKELTVMHHLLYFDILSDLEPSRNHHSVWICFQLLEPKTKPKFNHYRSAEHNLKIFFLFYLRK